MQKVLVAELAEERVCMVGHVVLCELVWVLHRLYGYSLAQRQQAIASLLDFAGLRFEALPALLTAYKAWQKHGGDWADHLIGAQMQSLGCEAVLTLNKAASRTQTHRLLA